MRAIRCRSAIRSICRSSSPCHRRKTPEKWLEAESARRLQDRLRFLAAYAGADRALREDPRRSRLRTCRARPQSDRRHLEDRPAPPQGTVKRQPPRLAGETAAKKLARIVTALGSHDALFVSDPHAVAWTFNIRGSDVAYTPLPLAFALIPRDGRPRLYIEAAKLNAASRANLEEARRHRRVPGLENDLDASAGRKRPYCSMPRLRRCDSRGPAERDGWQRRRSARIRSR